MSESIPNQIRRAATYHAAVACMMVKERGPGNLDYVTIVPTAHAAGEVKFHDLERVLSADEMKKQVSIMLVGTIAEYEILGVKGGDRARHDFEAALHHAERIVAQTTSAGDQQAVVGIIRDCRADALRFVTEHRDGIIKVADALVERQKLSGDEVILILNG